MAGIDPLNCRRLCSRIVEFHLKDCRGGSGTQGSNSWREGYATKETYLHELGKGGVDFPGILAYSKSTGRVADGQLDSTDTTPKTAAQSKKYLNETLNLSL
jgi:hypothetical protein